MKHSIFIPIITCIVFLSANADMMKDSPVTFPKEGALPAKYPPDLPSRTNEATEKGYYLFHTPERSLAQIEQIQSDMPKGKFKPPLQDWLHLHNTRRILTKGGKLRLLALGDSIVNDTMRSGWVARLRAAYQKADIQAMVYVRGGGGCQHYKEKGRIAKYVVTRKPNLILIGGVSQKSIEDIREVINQLRASLPKVEIILTTGAFGTTDPRDANALAMASYSGTGDYGQSLKKLAAEENCAYLDMTAPWAEYIRASGQHPHRYYRDVVHANEYGEQILSKILMAFFGQVPENDSAQAVMYKNPVIEGNLADPSVIYHEGVYYLYATGEVEGDNGYRAYTSTNLVDWQQGPVVFRPGQPHIWAPDIRRDPDSGRFFLYYTANRNIGVAEAEGPLGPFDIRCQLFDHAIDAHLFRDDDGQMYLYFVQLPGFHIMVQPMVSPTEPKGQPRMILRPESDWETRAGRVTEGPWIIKRQGRYYLLYSGSGADTPDYAVGYAKADNPMGPFKRAKHNPILHRSDYVFGPGHGCAVRDHTGHWWYIYHQKRTKRVEWDRFICIDPLWFDQYGNLFGKATCGKPQPAPPFPEEETKLCFEPLIWRSEPPNDCPFEQSHELTGIEFTGIHSDYRFADTWYPTWAADGNLYSPWTDGQVHGERSNSNGHGSPSMTLGGLLEPQPGKARTGQAVMSGEDPLNLTIKSLGTVAADPFPYGGRYPCGSLVYGGVWFYGTYCLAPYGITRFGETNYNWPWLGPFVGFRISYDLGKTWEETPHTPAKPLFGETGMWGHPVKIGAPHFVDFGCDMEHSPGGMAYLVAHGAEYPDPKHRFANLSWITGDQVYLLRVKPSSETINDPNAYEFFSGYDVRGQPLWTSEFKDIKSLLEWNNNMGCVTVTYVAPLKKYLMFITDGGNTCSRMHTYALESGSLTGPWRLVSYMRNLGEQAYFVNLPSKFISCDGRIAWLCYSGNFAKDWNNDRIQVNPPGSRYGLVLQKIRLLGPEWIDRIVPEH